LMMDRDLGLLYPCQTWGCRMIISPGKSFFYPAGSMMVGSPGFDKDNFMKNMIVKIGGPMV